MILPGIYIFTNNTFYLGMVGNVRSQAEHNQAYSGHNTTVNLFENNNPTVPMYPNGRYICMETTFHLLCIYKLYYK